MQSVAKYKDPVCELFVLSFASLFLELLIIRWMGGDIHAFSIFKTFPLVTCYVGLGVGCALGSEKHFRLLPWALLIMAVILKLPDLLGIWQTVTFPTASGFSDWGQAGLAAQSIWTYMIFFAPFLVLVLSGPFAVMAALGSRIGALFNALSPLKAYSVNIGGAIAGSLIFSVLSFQGLTPWQMLILPCVLIGPDILSAGASGKLGPVILAASVAAASWAPHYEFDSTICYPQNEHFDVPDPRAWTFWSPYQRLDVVQQRFVTKVDGKLQSVDLGVNVYSNRRGYQAAMELAESSFEKYKSPILMQFIAEYRRRYHLPFQLRVPGDILIVGAGSGTDVKEALNAGAKHIDALDIDPTIINIGRQFNPGKPYEDPHVSVICDDARHYFNHCRKNYDMIVFSHLDSMAAIGQGASVRVDNYVYTLQSFQTAMKLLKPDGLMVVSFCTKKDWFRDRLYRTLKEAIGYPPLVINDLRSSWLIPNTFFIAGPDVKAGKITLPQGNEKAFAIAQNYDPMSARLLTDDWPYLYVTPEPIDLSYLIVVLEIIAISLFAGRKVIFGPSDPLDWQLFFMGGAFLLLELQSISRLSLLYGSSWFTSAVVINAVLLMILGANLLVIGSHGRVAKNLHLLFGGLLVALLISFFLPMDLLLATGASSIGGIVATVLTVLPMFMAGLIFSGSFEAATSPRRALAFNLLGAVCGALLEYLSNYTGVKSLVLVAALLYFCSWLCFCKRGKAQSIERADGGPVDAQPVDG
jgi:hypothetical protein